MPEPHARFDGTKGALRCHAPFRHSQKRCVPETPARKALPPSMKLQNQPDPVRLLERAARWPHSASAPGDRAVAHQLVLAETFMLERTDPATYRYRLAGTRLCEIFGSELRDTNLLDGWSASDRTLAGAQPDVDLRARRRHAVRGRGRYRHAAARCSSRPSCCRSCMADNTIDRVIGAMAPMISRRTGSATSL